MENRIWILGADDPEMSAIERLLVEAGERVAHALDDSLARVHAGNAYRGTGHRYLVDCGPAGDTSETWCLVECTVPVPAGCPIVRIDHHREGDPGFGRAPSDFFAASSLGQICAQLDVAVLYAHRDDACRVLSDHEGQQGWAAKWSGLGQPICADGVTPFGSPVVPGAQRWPTGKHGIWSGMPVPDRLDNVTLDARDALFVAAADHCLGAAYRGECPGVDPDELRRWRVESRAAFGQRTVAAVLADIEATSAALRSAPKIPLAILRDDGWIADAADAAAADEMQALSVADMRRPSPWPELPEAACYLGIGYLAGPLTGPDGRHKIVCSGSAEQIRVFLSSFAPANGITDTYGDPARGLAGGYLP